MALSLPIIDLEKAKDPEQRLAVAKQLVHALETFGFLFIDNAEGYDADKLMDSCRWFFNLSEQEKRSVQQNDNEYRGFFPVKPGEASFKEAFEIGLDNPSGTTTTNDNDKVRLYFTKSNNRWPHSGLEGSERFQKDMKQQFSAMLNCGDEILRLVCLGYGVDETWFQSEFFPDSLSTLRLLHYPPRPKSEVPSNAVEGDTVICCPEHCDSGFVTLLATGNYAGLEIKLEDGADWIPVPSRPQSLVMNIGDTLSWVSGGRFKATNHRVLDLGVDRFSVPFFLEPRFSADITRVLPVAQQSTQDCQNTTATGGEGSVAKSAESTYYGYHLISKMRGYAEYKDLIARFDAEAKA